MRLILTRHAKSDWSTDALRDHDRPLNDRGIRSAAALGRWLADAGTQPDRVVLSTARRVVETWAGIAPALPRPVETRPSSALYNASPETILEELGRERADCLMVIAHNPGLAALAQWLVRETPKRVEFHRYPTGATLVLDLRVAGWGAIVARCADVVDFVVPRDLAS